MKHYDYVLLDWDGNLAKTLDVWLRALRVPLERRGLKLNNEEIAQCFGAPREYYEKIGVTDMDQFFMEMDAATTELLPEVDLYPGALFVLEGLKKAGSRPH